MLLFVEITINVVEKLCTERLQSYFHKNRDIPTFYFFKRSILYIILSPGDQKVQVGILLIFLMEHSVYVVGV